MLGVLALIAVPTAAVNIKSPATGAGLLEASIADVALLASDERLTWTQNADARRYRTRVRDRSANLRLWQTGLFFSGNRDRLS
jgi:hypothetical protein